jgi:hypothetical protein
MSAPPPIPTTGIKVKKLPTTETPTLKKLKEFKDYPTEDLSKTDWTKIKAMAESQNGSVGVLFALTENDKIIVIKTNQNIAEEMFAAELAQLLGICCPKIRLIQEGKSNEYQEIMEKIKQLAGPTKVFSRFHFFKF